MSKNCGACALNSVQVPSSDYKYCILPTNRIYCCPFCWGMVFASGELTLTPRLLKDAGVAPLNLAKDLPAS